MKIGHKKKIDAKTKLVQAIEFQRDEKKMRTNGKQCTCWMMQKLWV